MWTNTIGQAPDAQAGSNSAIEAAINAPMHGGGRKARQAAAASVVAQTGIAMSRTVAELQINIQFGM